MKKTSKLVSALILIISFVGIAIWQLLFVDSVNYYIISVLLLVISMLPFFVRFEMKSTSSREITLIATLIALAVASRAAFYLIPQVKPISAVVIASAVCIGAERGYVVGAFSAFISNFIFGQGYWTPFQMVALGIVGLLAGLIFKVVKVNRFSLAIVGFLLSSIVYGLIVDLSTILMMCGNNLTIKAILSVYGAGVPFSVIFGISTAVFLFLFGETFVKKIDRAIIKFNLIKNNNKN